VRIVAPLANHHIVLIWTGTPNVPTFSGSCRGSNDDVSKLNPFSLLSRSLAGNQGFPDRLFVRVEGLKSVLR